MTAPQTRLTDEQLHELAGQRLKEHSDFRWHLVTYLVINGMLWVVWLLVNGVNSHPWPIWLTLFWGIAVAFHWGYATRRRVDSLAVETEIARLRAER